MPASLAGLRLCHEEMEGKLPAAARAVQGKQRVKVGLFVPVTVPACAAGCPLPGEPGPLAAGSHTEISPQKQLLLHAKEGELMMEIITGQVDSFPGYFRGGR